MEDRAGGEIVNCEMLRISIVKAKKDHRCECYSIIKKGELYTYYVGKTDDDFHANKLCSKCSYVMENIHTDERLRNLTSFLLSFESNSNVCPSMLKVVLIVFEKPLFISTSIVSV